MLKEASKQFLQKSKAIILILVGTITWSLTMVRSGLTYPFGIGFWGANGHDAIWHLALIESLSKGNFQMPVFSGFSLKNYHLGFDLLMAWIVRLTTISPSIIYFQIAPPVLAFLIGILTYRFVFDWTKSTRSSLLATFFIYFGGSFGWIVSLFRGQGWGGESMFWAQQSISTLINPPFALSLVMILVGLIFLKKFLEEKNLLNFILTTLFFGFSIFVKVYAGLLVLVSLIAISLWQIVKKKDYSLLLLGLITTLISLGLLSLFDKSSASLIVYKPFWFLETMLIAPDRFYWPRLYSAVISPKVIPAYILTFLIFIIGNFGTRLIAIGSIIKSRKKLFTAGPIEVFIFTLIISGIIVPLFFIQKGTPWNTIQFLYYSLFFSGIVAGVTLGQLLEKSKLNTLLIRIIIVVVVVLTIPTTLASMGNYFPGKPQSILPVSEIEALKFLSTQPDGVVLTYPYDIDKANAAKAPRPLYLYTSTSYVSAFSGKETFMEDQINLDIMQYPWQKRRESVEEFLNMVNTSSAQLFLKNNNIQYVYWVGGQHAQIPNQDLGLKQIFGNDNVTILEVN